MSLPQLHAQPTQFQMPCNSTVKGRTGGIQESKSLCVAMPSAHALNTIWWPCCRFQTEACYWLAQLPFVQRRKSELSSTWMSSVQDRSDAKTAQKQGPDYAHDRGAKLPNEPRNLLLTAWRCRLGGLMRSHDEQSRQHTPSAQAQGACSSQPPGACSAHKKHLSPGSHEHKRLRHEHSSA